MNEINFEGTLVLEKMAEINKLDEFMEAIDNDDFERIASIMRKAGFDHRVINNVLKQIE